MITDAIDAAARAGHSARFAGRRGHEWDQEPNAVQIRWELAAAKVLNGNITSPAALRASYMDGYTAVKTGDEIGRTGRDLWRTVFTEMVQAGASLRPASRHAHVVKVAA